MIKIYLFLHTVAPLFNYQLQNFWNFKWSQHFSHWLKAQIGTKILRKYEFYDFWWKSTLFSGTSNHSLLCITQSIQKFQKCRNNISASNPFLLLYHVYRVRCNPNLSKHAKCFNDILFEITWKTKQKKYLNNYLLASLKFTRGLHLQN